MKLLDRNSVWSTMSKAVPSACAAVDGWSIAASAAAAAASSATAALAASDTLFLIPVASAESSLGCPSVESARIAKWIPATADSAPPGWPRRDATAPRRSLGRAGSRFLSFRARGTMPVQAAAAAAAEMTGGSLLGSSVRWVMIREIACARSVSRQFC